MGNFKEDLIDYILSGHALLNVDTFEKDRAIAEIAEAAAEIDRKVFVWSISQGWIDEGGIAVSGAPKSKVPVEDHLPAILGFPEKTVCVLRDFGLYLQQGKYSKHDMAIGYLDDLRKIISSVEQTIVFVGPDFHVPKQLLHDITTIEFSLPDKKQIAERISYVCRSVETEDGGKFEPDPEILPQIIDACQGMITQQVADRVALALRKHKDLNVDAVQTIIREKAAIIRASGLLTYIEPPEGGLDSVGGYEALKQHIRLDQPCFTQEARDFGIEFPKGLMLVGIPGCGKTLLSLAVASELGLPLISLDVGSIMNKYVGESESNMRDAIRMLETIAPCVLVLDEIEKGFGGTGDSDGGSSRRVFGIFLKWLNDKTSPVYVIATANQVQSLPPEFCRKGRFDEIFGLDLPSEGERQEIFNIHLSKRNKISKDLDITKLAIATPGCTGADIEQIVKVSLKIAFGNDKKLKQKHLIQAIGEIIPLSVTESDRIGSIRMWCKKHAKPANPHKENPQPKAEGRKIVLSNGDPNSN
ncbi:hypothetical protein LCGC14_0142650 [marine sediment metagenome]|uniref:Uncharacterized AAA domain-containing protein ycf46 n=1 Tax=marine sediment metagenome TaxID=412755 RepID=A0A0F9V1A1_9ZZZZ